MGAATQVASLYGELGLRDNLSGQLSKAGKNFEKAADKMKKTGKKLTKNVTLPIVALGGAAVYASIDWEDAFAGVRKTVDGTESELADLERGLRKLATSADSPVSSLANAHVELAGVAEAAGQLGVELPDILVFTETMGLLGMATDVSAQEAAVLAAQFANITGMDIGEEIDNFASSLVWLGNNSATTEGTILQLAQRIALAGSNAGLNESQILALAAAVASLGFAPERAGTNLSKFLNEISTAVSKGGADLKTLAEVAGMDPVLFKTTWETDSKVALVAFLKGLGQLDIAEQIELLDGMGLSGATTQEVIMALAGDEGIGLLTASLEGSAEAWERATDAMSEGEKRAETTKGQINLLKNNANELAITVGDRLLPTVNLLVTGLLGLIAHLQETNPAVLDLGIGLLALAAIAGPVTWALGSILGLLTAISLPILGIIALVAFLGYAWATNFGGMRDWTEKVRTELEEADIAGLLSAIWEGVMALPKTIVGADAWTAGIEGWNTTFASIKEMVIWIGDQAGGLLSGIDIQIPGALRDMANLISDIVKGLGIINSNQAAGPIGDPALTHGGAGPAPALTGSNIGTSATGTAPHGGRPGRAGGGPVSYGSSYIVGERGPELFVPGRSGSIVPNGALGGRVVNISTVNVYGVQDADNMLDQIERAADRRGMRLAVN